MKMRAIEHRPVQLPNRTLTSPKVTHHKLQSEAHCRMCKRPHKVRPLTRHHLVPVSWFLSQPWKLRQIRNAHANVIPLCRPCHDIVDNKVEDERVEARKLLRRSLSQQELTFAILIRGLAWLDEQYPRI